MKNSATAGHFVFLGPCPATSHLVIAFSKSSVFNLFSFFRVLKLILKMRSQNFQNKSFFIQRGEDRALGKLCDPSFQNTTSVLLYRNIDRLALCWLENFDCYIS